MKPWKGGRTARIEGRITPDLKEWLVEYLSPSGWSVADWLTDKIREAQAEHAAQHSTKEDWKGGRGKWTSGQQS